MRFAVVVAGPEKGKCTYCIIDIDLDTRDGLGEVTFEKELSSSSFWARNFGIIVTSATVATIKIPKT